MPLKFVLSEIDRLDFIRESDWSGAEVVPLREDWSQRKFFRLSRKNHTAVLIHSVPDHDPHALPGHKLGDFVRIAKFLKSIEISVPEIYAQDIAKGLLLVEDFGDWSFADSLVRQDPRISDLYKFSKLCLSHLYQHTEFVPIDLPDYYKSHIHVGQRRVIDWYLPAILGRQNEDGVVELFHDMMRQLEKQQPRVFRRFLHGDFHPGNLMYLPERKGFRQIGLLDFQGGMMGPAPYDLVNLLDDARRIVPDDIRSDCLAAFLSQLQGEERESFEAWYPILAVQFHFRVIGQALRLAIRDKKTGLLDLLPVLRAHIMKDFENPVLGPVKDWFLAHGVDFTETAGVSPEHVQKFIREDAF